jgi:polysaccharide export outer membrane protein
VRFVGLAYFSAFCASMALGGCSVLPADGPANMDVRAGQQDIESLNYALVKLTPGVVDILARYTPRLSAAFVDRRPPKDIRLGIGDVVRVSIFEAGAGGLFIPAEASVRPGNFVDLPPQNVDNSGNITVPYCPPIKAVGRNTQDVQQSIVEALKNRAIEPQVVVSVAEQRTSLISVLGDVKAASRFPANREGERVLDAIARAQGPVSQGFDEWVMLERGGRRAAVPFGALVYEPSNNIWAHPNDTIYLYREPQTFLAFGASGRQAVGAASGSVSSAQIPFDAWRISLAEAVAKAGGLNDDKADPASVFLYRGETRSVAEQLGIDISKFEGPIIPVIYIIDFRDPAGFFIASKFAMRNKDVIYVSNSFSVESTKAMTYFRMIIGTINDPIVAATNALTFRNLIAGTTGTTTAIAVGGAVR